ncbi:hypothetical protein [Baekduia sp. Peel2402]
MPEGSTGVLAGIADLVLLQHARPAGHLDAEALGHGLDGVQLA